MMYNKNSGKFGTFTFDEITYNTLRTAIPELPIMDGALIEVSPTSLQALCIINDALATI